MMPVTLLLLLAVSVLGTAVAQTTNATKEAILPLPKVVQAAGDGTVTAPPGGDLSWDNFNYQVGAYDTT